MALATFLNGRTPSQLRGVAWLGLSATGQVGSVGTTDDGGGGATQTWSYGTSIACRIDPLAGSERIVASKLSDRSTFLITTPPGVTVGIADRFRFTNGGTFEVTAIRSRTAEPLTFFEAVQVS